MVYQDTTLFKINKRSDFGCYHMYMEVFIKYEEKEKEQEHGELEFLMDRSLMKKNRSMLGNI